MHGHTTFNKINRHAARLMRHGIFGPGRNFVRRCLTIKCPTFYRQCLILAGSRQNFLCIMYIIIQRNTGNEPVINATVKTSLET